MWSDDGIVIRLPEAADDLPIEELLIDPEDIDELVVSTLPADLALLRPLPGVRGPGPAPAPPPARTRRTPLWQQRQRAADLLAVAAKYPSFPILLEASRECLQDVFDVPALREVLGQLRSRQVRLVSVDTAKASPFAQSLLFNWIAAYMYEGDAPLAERRAAALALDRDLLRELLGRGGAARAARPRRPRRPGAGAAVPDRGSPGPQRRRAARRAAPPGRPVPGRAGPAHRGHRRGGRLDGGAAWPSAGRSSVRIGAEERVIAAEDAARYRDALGCAIPVGLPVAFTDPVARPLEQLVGRYARTHGPFLADAPARRFELAPERVVGALAALEAEERLVRGEFRPDGLEREWCDVEVLRQLRRRSLAALRREVEPVEQEALARFLPAWHGIPAQRRGLDALVETLGLLQGAPLVASTLERDVLPARVLGYRSGDLDDLCTSGDIVWVGAGSLGASDGRLRLCFRDQLAAMIGGAGGTGGGTEPERPGRVGARGHP